MFYFYSARRRWTNTYTRKEGAKYRGKDSVCSLSELAMFKFRMKRAGLSSLGFLPRCRGRQSFCSTHTERQLQHQIIPCFVPYLIDVLVIMILGSIYCTKIARNDLLQTKAVPLLNSPARLFVVIGALESSLLLIPVGSWYKHTGGGQGHGGVKRCVPKYFIFSRQLEVGRFFLDHFQN